LKKRLSFIGLLVFLFIAWPTAVKSDEILVPAPTIKALQGNWNNIRNIVVNGVNYPVAYTIGNSNCWGYIDYVVSHKYRYFVAELGICDDGPNEEVVNIYGNNDQNNPLLVQKVKLGTPITQIRIPIADYVRMEISCRNNVVWINPCFVK